MPLMVKFADAKVEGSSGAMPGSGVSAIGKRSFNSMDAGGGNSNKKQFSGGMGGGGGGLIGGGGMMMGGGGMAAGMMPGTGFGGYGHGMGMMPGGGFDPMSSMNQMVRLCSTS